MELRLAMRDDSESRLSRDYRVLLILFDLVLLFTLVTVGAGQAYGVTYATASVSNNKVVKVSAKEKKAYNRALAACMDYKNQPNPIVVDMSDLKLTKKQALNVGEMLHGNGELFFINTYNDSSYNKKKFVLSCYYSDKRIDRKSVV